MYYAICMYCLPQLTLRYLPIYQSSRTLNHFRKTGTIVDISLNNYVHVVIKLLFFIFIWCNIYFGTQLKFYLSSIKPYKLWYFYAKYYFAKLKKHTPNGCFQFFIRKFVSKWIIIKIKTTCTIHIIIFIPETYYITN